MTLRDERNRLLGYIIYPLKGKGDAARLREHLAANNRFHNVLVVYPDQGQASLELWQGRSQLRGQLRKGQEYKDAADVVNLLSRFFIVSKSKVRSPAIWQKSSPIAPDICAGLRSLNSEKNNAKDRSGICTTLSRQRWLMTRLKMNSRTPSLRRSPTGF